MIYCVEDDASIRELEVYTLLTAGFKAEGFEAGTSFREALEVEMPELIILDIMLPGESGVDILRKLKSEHKTKSIPVVMATAKDQEHDKILSLDLGADDYLVKPFGMMEMISRVKAVLRRCNPAQAPQLLKSGGVVLSSDEHVVTVDGERIPLTYKEFEILRLFLSNPGIAFSREKLFNKVWGMNYSGETRTVDMHIRTLRQKLGVYGDRIETLRNVGYRMEASA